MNLKSILRLSLLVALAAPAAALGAGEKRQRWSGGSGSWGGYDACWLDAADGSSRDPWQYGGIAVFPAGDAEERIVVDGPSALGVEVDARLSPLVFEPGYGPLLLGRGGFASAARQVTVNSALQGEGDLVLDVGSGADRSGPDARLCLSASVDVGGHVLEKRGGGVLELVNANLRAGRLAVSSGTVAFDRSTIALSGANVTLGRSGSALYVTNTAILASGDAFGFGEGGSNERVELVSTTGGHGGSYVDCAKSGVLVGRGEGACDNLLVVDGGGVTGGAYFTNMVYNTSGLSVGRDRGDSCNVVRVQNGGAIYDEITVNNVANGVGMADGANGNRLEILGGGRYVSEVFKSRPGNVGLHAATGNVVTVDARGVIGSARLSTRGGQLYVGSLGGVGNALVVTNGGVVTYPEVFVGYAGHTVSNFVHVTGKGSRLQGLAGATTLCVGGGEDGFEARGNRLVISDYGVVTNFEKWSQLSIGSHEHSYRRGRAIGNGLELLSGGSMFFPRHVHVGRVTGEGSEASGNFLHVADAPTSFRTGFEGSLYVGDAGEGAVARRNFVLVERGAHLWCNCLWLGRDVKTKVPGGYSGNCVLVRSGAFLQLNSPPYDHFGEIGLGIEGDDPAHPVAVDNRVIVSGGKIETRWIQVYSGGGNVLSVVNGGVLQFPHPEVRCILAAPGTVAITNAVVSFRCPTADVRALEQGHRLEPVTCGGRNAFRLDATGIEVANTSWMQSQAYVFDDTGDPRNFVRLELVGGNTEYRSGERSDVLTIGEKGAMLCSNTLAKVFMPLRLRGRLRLTGSELFLCNDQADDRIDGEISVDLDALPADGALHLGPRSAFGPGAHVVFTGDATAHRGAVVMTASKELLPPRVSTPGVELEKTARENGGWAYRIK